MWILLVISFLILLLYVGHLMTKLDKFLSKGGLMIEDDKIYPVAIVLGGTDVAKQIIGLLQKNSIPVLTLTEPFLLKQEQNFRYLFALSEKDVDNIILCNVGKKVYSIEKIVSLCNDRRNDGMFISEGIPYLPTEDVTAQMLYDAVLEEKELKFRDSI